MESDVVKGKVDALTEWVNDLATAVPVGSLLREFLLEAKAKLQQAKTVFEPVERKEVQSTTIKSFGYNPAARVLEVEFKNESVYRYYKVSQIAVTTLEQADSIGKVFSQVIKSNTDLPYEKIKDAKPKVSQTQYEGML